MKAMPAKEIEKIQKSDSVEKLEELNLEYNELEPFYDQVIKRLEDSITIK